MPTKGATLKYFRMMLSVASSALYVGSGIVVTHERVFAEAAADDGDPSRRACVDKPDHSGDITDKDRHRFPRALGQRSQSLGVC